MEWLEKLDVFIATELIRRGLRILTYYDKEVVIRELQKLIPAPAPKVVKVPDIKEVTKEKIVTETRYVEPWRDKKGHKWISTKRGTACEFCLRLLATGAEEPCD